MLVLHHGNRLETLADALAALLAEPAGHPLAPDIVVVQNAGMARWVSMWLARALGIAANLRFPFPAQFAWQVFRSVLPGVPETAALDPEALTWRLMGALPGLAGRPEFAAVRAYLEGHDDRRRFDLARRIADLFDGYLVYRPDWIRAWEAGAPTEGVDRAPWQPVLWRAVLRGDERHRVRLWDELLSALAPAAAVRAGLPPRVAVFGVPTMPPLHLDVLAALAQHVDVHLFLVNPCREWWGDIVSERERIRRERASAGEVLHLEVGNPLLASLGAQGRDFLGMVFERMERVGGDEDPRFVEPGEATLLAALQSDVLALRDRAAAGAPAVPRDADGSIQLHACHGAVREVEVLHDRLLALFDAHPDLAPADVVVMTPDIEAYAPAIEAVFAAAPEDRAIPFSIADRLLPAESPVVAVFLALLDLPGSRYEAPRVLGLLQHDPLRRRFDLGEADVARVREWVRASGVRWGIDERARAALGLPAVRTHTWRFGLDRLLLGHALPGEAGDPFAGVLPYDDVEGGQAVVLGRLVRFAERAFALADDLRTPRAPAAWADRLSALLDEFVAVDADGDMAGADEVRGALERLRAAAGDAAFADAVSLDVVKRWLAWQLDVPRPTGRFLAGRVTFCAMVPMRSIPFEVVCLIGMNDGAYPRARRPPGFDLMSARRRPGDRSRRDDDRYLFLEALVSARRCFYLSWVGRDARDNTELPPSVLVRELLDHLAGAHGTRGLVVEHPLQAFSRRYFDGTPGLFSFAAELCEASRVSRRQDRGSRRFCPTRLPEAPAELRTIPLERLRGFVRNPARVLLRDRLGIRLGEADALVEAREPFHLGGLAGYQLEVDLVNAVRGGRVREQELARLRGRGALPHPPIGEAVLAARWHAAADLAGRMDAAGGPPCAPMAVALEFGDLRLEGELGGITAAGLVGGRPAAPKGRDRLALWVDHLLLCALAPAGVTAASLWLGSSGDFAFRTLAPDEARSQLARLVALCWDGLHRLVPLPPNTAYEWVHKREDDEAARRAWTGAWDGPMVVPGEGADPYLALAFGDSHPVDAEFRDLAREVLGPMVAATERR